MLSGSSAETLEEKIKWIKRANQDSDSQLFSVYGNRANNVSRVNKWLGRKPVLDDIQGGGGEAGRDVPGLEHGGDPLPVPRHQGQPVVAVRSLAPQARPRRLQALPHHGREQVGPSRNNTSNRGISRFHPVVFHTFSLNILR